MKTSARPQASKTNHTAAIVDLAPKTDQNVRGGAPNVSEMVVTKTLDGSSIDQMWTRVLRVHLQRRQQARVAPVSHISILSKEDMMKTPKKSKPRVSDLRPKKGKDVNGGLSIVKYVDKSSPK